jgi:hypothetical protein
MPLLFVTSKRYCSANWLWTSLMSIMYWWSTNVRTILYSVCFISFFLFKRYDYMFRVWYENISSESKNIYLRYQFLFQFVLDKTRSRLEKWYAEFVDYLFTLQMDRYSKELPSKIHFLLFYFYCLYLSWRIILIKLIPIQYVDTVIRNSVQCMISIDINNSVIK